VEFPADLPLVTGVGGNSVFIGSHRQWVASTAADHYFDADQRGLDPARPAPGSGGAVDQPAVHPAVYQASNVPASIRSTTWQH
jgi:hypothetical protein